MKKITPALVISFMLFGCYDTLAANSKDEAFQQNIQDMAYTFLNYKSIDAFIDPTMDEIYILAAKNAIQEFNKIGNINIFYNDEYSFMVDYEIVFTEYNDLYQDYCSEDDSEVAACNVPTSDEYFITSSTIYFNVGIMNYLTEDWIYNIALHELGHVFGLKDLYEDMFEKMSIMYYSAEDIVLSNLTEFDIENLEYVYSGD